MKACRQFRSLLVEWSYSKRALFLDQGCGSRLVVRWQSLRQIRCDCSESAARARASSGQALLAGMPPSLLAECTYSQSALFLRASSQRGDRLESLGETVSPRRSARPHDLGHIAPRIGPAKPTQADAG
jgi:hypothetical protein